MARMDWQLRGLAVVVLVVTVAYLPVVLYTTTPQWASLLTIVVLSAWWRTSPS